jgi:hypothetical protein
MSPAWKALAALSASFLYAPQSFASCDDVVFIGRIDVDELSRCVKELKSDLFLKQAQLAAIESENRLLARYICTLVTDLSLSNIHVNIDAADVCRPLKPAKKSPQRK